MFFLNKYRWKIYIFFLHELIQNSRYNSFPLSFSFFLLKKLHPDYMYILLASFGVKTATVFLHSSVHLFCIMGCNLSVLSLSFSLSFCLLKKWTILFLSIYLSFFIVKIAVHLFCIMVCNGSVLFSIFLSLFMSTEKMIHTFSFYLSLFLSFHCKNCCTSLLYHGM